MSDDQWQPIDTCPKDGSTFVVLEPFEPCVVSAYFDAETDEIRPSRGGPFWEDPTHWMPLPKQPKRK